MLVIILSIYQKKLSSLWSVIKRIKKLTLEKEFTRCTTSFNIQSFQILHIEWIYLFIFFTVLCMYIIQWSVIAFVTETDWVYYAVRAECLNKNQVVSPS